MLNKFTQNKIKIFLLLATSLVLSTGCIISKNKISKENADYNSGPEFTTVNLSTKSNLEPVDHNNPAAVVQAIFDSASSRDLSYLPKLCDPNGENDERTRLICELSEDDKMLFIIEFENGKVLGDAIVDGDIAKVPYAYGYDGSDKQTMDLIKRDNQWYLYHFFSK